MAAAIHKVGEPRFWEVWRRSGAIGRVVPPKTIDSGPPLGSEKIEELLEQAARFGLPIYLGFPRSEQFEILGVMNDRTQRVFTVLFSIMATRNNLDRTIAARAFDSAFGITELRAYGMGLQDMMFSKMQTTELLAESIRLEGMYAEVQDLLEKTIMYQFPQVELGSAVCILDDFVVAVIPRGVTFDDLEKRFPGFNEQLLTRI